MSFGCWLPIRTRAVVYFSESSSQVYHISVYPHVISVVADSNIVNLSTSGFIVSVKIQSYLTIHVWLDIIQNWATKMTEIFMVFFKHPRSQSLIMLKGRALQVCSISHPHCSIHPKINVREHDVLFFCSPPTTMEPNYVQHVLASAGQIIATINNWQNAWEPQSAPAMALWNHQVKERKNR